MIQVGALSVRFLVEAADSNGSVSVFECFVPADSNMPLPHSHDAFEETIYGLGGVITWVVDGRTLDIRLGEAFCVPRELFWPVRSQYVCKIRDGPRGIDLPHASHGPPRVLQPSGGGVARSGDA